MNRLLNLLLLFLSFLQNSLLGQVVFDQNNNYTYFDGYDDYIQLSNDNYDIFDLNEEGTIEFWFNSQNIEDKSVIFQISGPLTSENIGNGISVYTENNTLYVGTYISNVKTQEEIVNPEDENNIVSKWYKTTKIKKNNWHHFAYVFEKQTHGKSILYLDGIKILESEKIGNLDKLNIKRISSTNSSPFPSSNAIWENDITTINTIEGHDIYNDERNYFFHGRISLLRVWNKSRKLDQIIETINDQSPSHHKKPEHPHNAELNHHKDIKSYLHKDGIDFNRDEKKNHHENDKQIIGDKPIWSYVAKWTGNDNNNIEDKRNWLNKEIPDLTSGTTTLILEKDLKNYPNIASNQDINLLVLSIPKGEEVNIESDGSLSVHLWTIINGTLNNGGLLKTYSISIENQGILNTKTEALSIIYKNIINKGEVNLEALGRVTIEGLDSNINNLGGEILLKSNEKGSASLIINGKLLNSGTIKSQKWLNEAKTWQLVSSPSTNEVSDIFYGHFLNQYIESEGSFKAINSTSHILKPGKGFVSKLHFEFGDNSSSNPLVFNGTSINYEDITIELNAGQGNSYFDLPEKFNLIGNPFTSNIDFNRFFEDNKNNIDNTMYFYVDNPDITKSGWATYTYIEGNEDYEAIIETAQAFGVILKESPNKKEVTFTNNIKTHNQKEDIKLAKKSIKTYNDYLILEAKSNSFTDEIKLIINDNSSNKYDGQYDVYKLNSFGSTPNLSFISSDNKKLAIDNRPYQSSINLSFKMFNTGKVSISLKENINFETLILEDKITNTLTNLTESKYIFDYNESGKVENRFVLHFNRNTLNNKEKQAHNIKTYINYKSIIIESSEPLHNANVKVYNIIGQKLLENNYDHLKNTNIHTDLNKGIYIIKIDSDKGNTTQKIQLIN